MDNRKKMSVIIKRLRKEYPVLRSALNYRESFELLVATILSAQTTDVHVNKVTVPLFKKYKTIRDFADAPLDQLRKDVCSVKLFQQQGKKHTGFCKDDQGEIRDAGYRRPWRNS